MASEQVTPGLLDRASASSELGAEWRRLTRFATAIAILTSPAPFAWFHFGQDWGIGWSLLATFFAVIAFRGLVDLLTRRLLPWPSLYGTDDVDLKEEDVVNRRRASFWRFWLKFFVFWATLFTIVFVIRLLVPGGTTNWIDSTTGIWSGMKGYLQQNLFLLFGLPFFFLFNFLILLGPMMMIGISQMRGFEPGDADWGVQLEDVRGQDEAKVEVSRVVSLWQSGEAFEEAGGKRERGLLFLGAPGTGKTMLAKAIATGFNCFAADVEFMTKEGVKSFAETAGTVQTVLNRDGEWVPAEIRSFGTQRLVEVELRPGRHTRSSIRVQVQATPDHRWLTENRGEVTDLREGDFVPFRGAGSEPRDVGAFIRGLGFGDGTLDARGRARIRLCGDKEHEHLPLFEEYGHCFVSYPPSYGGDPLVVFNGGHMSEWKEVPTGNEDPAWLASWLEGYLAADGWSTPDGARVLETQDADAIPLVKRIAPYAGYMVVGNHTKSSTVTNYGPRSSPLVALKLRREGFWQVIGVNEVATKAEVFCAVEPKTGTFTLAGGVLTGNCPFISMPGSGFQQTFMGMDAVIVRFLARKAKKLASKWGGQCIVFIDEIDAVGMRRSALGGGGAVGIHSGTQFADHLFYGPYGALNPSGDMILETRAWRDRLFAEREASPPAKPGRLAAIVNQGIAGGMLGGGGGQLALNQLLVVMDGIDNPPFFRRLFTNWTNTFLDATYVIPRRVGRVKLRVPRPRPRKDQIYFIGATNVPIGALDPALTRPGRMGRHVWLRTPTKHDRLDIFDLYIKKVSHEPDLDTEKRRDELARITSGYAQPLDSQLLTPTGWKRMGDVEVGDLLVGATGEATEVLAVHPRGQMDVFRVIFNDGTSTECTEDHLWTVEALDPRMSSRPMPLRRLIEQDLRWSPKGSRFYLPRLAPVEFASTGKLPLDPYLLGLLLGDGGFTYGTPDFCTADPETLTSVEALVPAGVSIMQHGPHNWRLSGGSRQGVPRSQANPLTQKLRELELWGLNGHDKFVPDQFKWASVEDRLGVLQGLMDTDGTVDYRRGTGSTFYSHSRQLAQDVAFLARSLGGTARSRVKREGWAVAVDLPDGLVPFRLSRKAGAYRSSRKPFRKRILKVEPLGKKVVQCVTVVADDGLYVTDGFALTHNSPAMIEQVCSMALTLAHSDRRERFNYEDIFEAMTTVESGTAINIEYAPDETRAVAIHEAGHAAASHVFMKDAQSTRISIRMRGGSLGHHQTAEQVERFSQWRSDQMAILIWGLGAMAAERVFYSQTSSGVGGDLGSATYIAALMVGAAGMGPEPLDRDEGLDGKERARVLKRFEDIGLQLMSRTGGGGPFAVDPVASVLGDRDKRRIAAQILGQAYVTAHNFILHNRSGIEHIADQVVARREIYGDDLLELLNESNLEAPRIDLMEEKAWPML